MNAEERLRRAAARLRSSLSDVTVPPPPQPRRRGWAVAAAAALLTAGVVGGAVWLAGMGEEPVTGEVPTSTVASSTVPDTSSTTIPTSLGDSSVWFDDLDVATPLCSSLEWPSAPETSYRDEPVYHDDHHDLVEAVRQFATTLPGFSQLWVDRGHHQWIDVGFVDADIDERQAQLAEAFPGEGVVAVALPYTERQLLTLYGEIDAILPAGMETYDINELAGYVGVWVGFLTPDHVMAADAAVAGYPVCVDGLEVSDYVAPGPQPAGGDGWRHLGEYDRSVGREPRVAASAAELEELWADLAVDDPVPEVDFSTEIVVTFEIGYGGGEACEITRLDDVVVTDTVLHAVIVTPTVSTGPDQGCFMLYKSRTYIVAVSRSELPAPPFTIKTSPAAIEETIVDIDLRQPPS